MGEREILKIRDREGAEVKREVVRKVSRYARKCKSLVEETLVCRVIMSLEGGEMPHWY